jgi:capsular polysaccharide export protein
LKRFAVFNRGLRRLQALGEFLGVEIVPVVVTVPASLDATLGWGRRRYARRAMRVAQARGIPFLCIEDGFLRSVGLGKDEPPLSIVVDDLGVYYDATTSSQLETLVGSALTPSQQERTRSLITNWRSARVSKYNHARDYTGELPERYVLVADQTFGDASIRYGMADAACFQRMLAAALAENPECTVLLKVHPEVMAGLKKGYFDLAAVSRNPRVLVLGQDVHPVSLIEHAQAVYVVTSQMGFEGLLWGKRVRTFGMPFYAGWGLTNDEPPAPKRRKPVALEQLVHAALVEYPRYVDPETGKRCEVERVLEHLALQRRMRERYPETVYALGFSYWKKPIVRTFFQGSEVRFVRRAGEAPAGAICAVWGRKPVPGRMADGVTELHLEDGFLRSVGLGADLVRPLSWVMDSRGIYYDATCPSDLESMLETTAFDMPLVERASRLRERIVTGGLTKYNVGTTGWNRPTHPHPLSGGEGDKRVILVPGQVENDASIRYGAAGIRTNMELLRTVREANPDAYVIYKPHPDVLAGLRARGQDEDRALAWCDEQVVDAAMGELLMQVNEVHVLTSLAGFEALLRGKRVVTHGRPFYAGWGLTLDMAPPARRTRRLTLDELVAGVLILYPTYVSRTTDRFTTPERALAELLSWREAGASGLPLWRKVMRPLLRRLKG